MTVYCGVDFHARQQTICFCDTADGEVCLRELRHDRDDVRGFHAQFTGDVIVRLEASGYSTWFVELLEGLGHQVFIGDAAEVRRRARRRQKNDRRDAELILDLLRKGEFPRIHHPSFESREVLRLLRYRHKLVQMRTRVKNSLQALAYGAGSARRARLLSRKGRERFLELPSTCTSGSGVSTIRTVEVELLSAGIPGDWHSLRHSLERYHGHLIEVVCEAGCFGYWLHDRLVEFSAQCIGTPL